MSSYKLLRKTPLNNTDVSVILFLQYEIAECLEDPNKIHGEVGEGLSFATGLIYQLATLQAVIRNIERYRHLL